MWGFAVLVWGRTAPWQRYMHARRSQKIRPSYRSWQDRQIPARRPASNESNERLNAIRIQFEDDHMASRAQALGLSKNLQADIIRRSKKLKDSPINPIRPAEGQMLLQDGGGHALRKTPETVFLLIEDVRHEGLTPILEAKKGLCPIKSEDGMANSKRILEAVSCRINFVEYAKENFYQLGLGEFGMSTCLAELDKTPEKNDA
ncbi:hypothetical protein K443DRAFT_123394 [Laccaria amethystina LaAM-08-1]|uniref:Uncharacterized protein n=1 Tax=Laccaria amethystina LaAM-08-1 TaxID=1095629 RepID=A0A0C9X1V6_9AGAR|nr:hypothetical protein K443DRAFT_123394 [Laccaria amethystina LaAM-08-1]